MASSQVDVRGIVAKIVTQRVKAFRSQKMDTFPCWACLVPMKMRHGRHMLCSPQCRKAWRRGWFFPKQV